jgi:hypothetical protein
MNPKIYRCEMNLSPERMIKKSITRSSIGVTNKALVRPILEIIRLLKTSFITIARNLPVAKNTPINVAICSPLGYFTLMSERNVKSINEKTM